MSSDFSDEISFSLEAGDGGNGGVSLRREKFVDKGGPDGGDGGRGGSIYFLADHNINTLADLAKAKLYKAEKGDYGRKQKQAGKSGEDLILKVPVGTEVFELITERGKVNPLLVADLSVTGQKVLIAKGGEGGLGNAHFARASFQTPRFAELGEPGEDKEITLKLKLVADVGLIGLPNAGKSTLLSVISNARPKIADYQFTTLIPNLGIAKVGDGSFVVADIPGLIEGASKGKGLGVKFLRHVERTRVLIHLIDCTNSEPLKTFKTIMTELKRYKTDLLTVPMFVVFTKIELIDETARKKLEKIKLPTTSKIYFISSATHQGLDELLFAVAKTLKDLGPVSTHQPVKIFTLADVPNMRFEVEKKSKWFLVKGPKQERLAIKTDFENPEAMGRFYKVLKRMGVLAELKKIGAKSGNKVKVGEKMFEYQEV